MINTTITSQNLCREDPSIALGDDATRIILNTKGSVGEISDELRGLLRYMDGCQPDDDYTRKLDSAVADVRADEKWRREYMVLNELIRDNKRLGGYTRSVAQARKLRKRYAQDELAEICLVSPELLKTILDTIDTHPDWDDEQIAENVDFE